MLWIGANPRNEDDIPSGQHLGFTLTPILPTTWPEVVLAATTAEENGGKDAEDYNAFETAITADYDA
jgi:hypothetical protein